MASSDESAAKKQKTEQRPPENIDAYKLSHLQVTVHTMGGNILLSACIESNILGQELLDLVLQQNPSTCQSVGKGFERSIIITQTQNNNPRLPGSG